MTPYELEILMHIKVTRSSFPRSEAPAYIGTTDGLVAMKVIKLSHDPHVAQGYELTKLGEAWLEVILNTPLPELVYIDHNGNVLCEA